jgi:glucokinase
VSAPETIGVDLGGTKMLVGVVDSERKVTYEGREPSTGLSEDRLVEDLARELQEAKDARPDVLAAGLGIPATIDHDKGLAIHAVNLTITDVPIRDLMQERIGLPVFVDNDATAAMLAEWRYGAAVGCTDALLLTIGTGIGGGMVVGGQLGRGAQGAAAEFGHMTIDVDGPLCPCGAHGCLEAFVSGTALAREARALGLDLTAAQVSELAHDGHTGARALVTEMGTRLGAGIANLVNAFNPQIVVVGGGVLALGDLLLVPAREEVARRALAPSRDLVQIVPTRFGAESGMVGAAVMALDGLAP